MTGESDRCLRLESLMEGIASGRLSGTQDLIVKEIVTDSRKVRPGGLFVAVPGEKTDGHAFVSDAARRGAVGVVVSRPVETPDPVTVIEVADTRKALARLAARFYGNPSSRLRMVAVTGTNGKTTTTYLVRAILEAAGRRVALIGTVGYALDEFQMDAPYTTPEPPLLHRLLAEAVERGIGDVVMEVSSHALELDRVLGCNFDVAVFTNLTQDHLDYHGTLENYFAAKEKLFTGLGARPGSPESRRVVINRDDAWGRRLLKQSEVPAWSYGESPEADIQAERIEAGSDGIRFNARTPAGDIPIESSLLGAYNVYNILAAVGVGLHYGLSPDHIARGVRGLRNVPGRFEAVDTGQDFNLIVDYAHSEAALERLLEAVGPVARGRIVTVFGCGGDRDRGKRAPMGRTAVRHSDWVILTSDNPRTEDPLEIIRQVEEGVSDQIRRGGRAQGYEIIPERREAIEKAVRDARAGDFIVVAGKGHEGYQLIGSERLPFDDRETAREALKKRFGAGSS
jgi:UDP-N-acetylmuramoyl-L-alanyl-D-glutamate--2,6-diaminopimelate ligase